MQENRPDNNVKKSISVRASLLESPPIYRLQSSSLVSHVCQLLKHLSVTLGTTKHFNGPKVRYPTDREEQLGIDVSFS